MSLITQVRSKADSAVRARAGSVLGSARSTLTLAGHVLTGAADETRGRLVSVTDGANASVNGAAGRATTTATTLLDRSFKQARKQALATVGAGDLVIDALTTRTEELSNEVQRNAGKGMATASARVRSARAQAGAGAGSMRARGGQVVLTVRRSELPEFPTVPAVRGAMESRVANARGTALGTFDLLAERGEDVVRSVRRNRRLLDTVTGVDYAAEDLADELSSVAGKLRYRAAANARSVRARKGAATRARSAATTGAPRVTVARARRNSSVTAPERTTAGKPAPRHTTSGRASAGTSTAGRPTGGKPTAVETTGSKSTGSKTSGSKSSGTKSSGAGTSPHKTATGKTASERSTARRTTARPASARAGTAKNDTAKTGSGKAASGKAASGKAGGRTTTRTSGPRSTAGRSNAGSAPAKANAASGS